jgi:hypothetical protein
LGKGIEGKGINWTCRIASQSGRAATKAFGYFHGEFRLGFCSALLTQPPLVGNIPAPQGAAPPNRTHI